SPTPSLRSATPTSGRHVTSRSDCGKNPTRGRGRPRTRSGDPFRVLAKNASPRFSAPSSCPHKTGNETKRLDHEDVEGKREGRHRGHRAEDDAPDPSGSGAVGGGPIQVQPGEQQLSLGWSGRDRPGGQYQ